MNTLKLKRCLAKFYPRAAIFPRKIILLYHAVGNGPQALAVEKFEEQMQWLSQHTAVLPLSELLCSNLQEEFQVCITFDDGYACLYEVVLPMLSKFNFTATVYVNTGWIAENLEHRRASDANCGHYLGESFLTWEEVVQLRKCGWEIGSHGVDHLDLTRQSDDKMRSELRQSKRMIEKNLQKQCQHFAYTWGRYNKKIARLVEEVGYLYASAAHHAPFSRKESRFALPRMNIDKNYSLQDFIEIIHGQWDYLAYIHKMKKITRNLYETRY